MADNDKETPQEAAAPAMTFTGIAPANLPGRTPKGFDQGTATALLTITAAGNAAQSGSVYETEAAARAASAPYKRMLAYVAPTGQKVSTRVYQGTIDGKAGYLFALTLAPVKAKK